MTRYTDEARDELRDLLDEGATSETFPLTIDDQKLSAVRVEALLAPFLTERRRARIAAVVAGRTRTVVPVVEGLVNVGNVSAVMRSAEALGYQAMGVVTGGAAFKQSARTSQGAEKWLDVRGWPSPAACAEHLRADGYRLVAMHLDEKAVPIGDVDFTRKTALVFGNEQGGVSEAMLEACDERCIIPLAGFTESFNVSVAAAVALHHAQQDRLRRQGRHADLSEGEQQALRARFYLRSVRRAEQVLRRGLREGQTQK